VARYGGRYLARRDEQERAAEVKEEIPAVD
jgi:hypothetical protein